MRSESEYILPPTSMIFTSTSIQFMTNREMYEHVVLSEVQFRTRHSACRREFVNDALVGQAGQQRSDLWKSDEDAGGEQFNKGEWEGVPDDLQIGATENELGGEYVTAEGRRGGSHGGLQDHQHAEKKWVNPVAFNIGLENGA